MEIDTKAWKILSAVQRDGRISLKALAEEACKTACKTFQISGVISVQ